MHPHTDSGPRFEFSYGRSLQRVVYMKLRLTSISMDSAVCTSSQMCRSLGRQRVDLELFFRDGDSAGDRHEGSNKIRATKLRIHGSKDGKGAIRN